MAWTSIIENVQLDDVRADRKTRKSVEMYGISQKAIYFRGEYLPISEIERVCVFPSVYRPHHSNGRGLPVFKLRIDYGQEKPLVLIFEKERNANRAAVLIYGRNRNVRIEQYINPLTGGTTKDIPPYLW